MTVNHRRQCDTASSWPNWMVINKCHQDIDTDYKLVIKCVQWKKEKTQMVFGSLLPREHLWFSTYSMTEKLECVKTSAPWNSWLFVPKGQWETAMGSREGPLNPLCSLHTEVVFSPETVSNNGKEEQRGRGPVASFYPCLESKATAAPTARNMKSFQPLPSQMADGAWGEQWSRLDTPGSSKAAVMISHLSQSWEALGYTPGDKLQGRNLRAAQGLVYKLSNLSASNSFYMKPRLGQEQDDTVGTEVYHFQC
jgi:hypothetical protein